MDRRVVIIIPNETILDVPVFERSIKNGLHYILKREFYELNILKIPSFNEMTNDLVNKYKCILIETFNEYAIVHIPSDITINQYQKLEQYISFFENFDNLEYGFYKNGIKYFNKNIKEDKKLITDFYNHIKEEYNLGEQYENRRTS